MNEKPHIYLVRHGETVWNREGRIQGFGDSPLTPLGIEQARQVGEILRAHLGEAADLPLITSPQSRAWQTGVIAADVMGRGPSDLNRDDRLRERRFGVFEGKTWTQIAEQHPEEYAAYRSDDPHYQVPGGESSMDLQARVNAWLAAQPLGQPRVVFSHGNTSRMLRGLYLGLQGNAWRALPETQGVVFHLKDGALDILTP